VHLLADLPEGAPPVWPRGQPFAQMQTAARRCRASHATAQAYAHAFARTHALAHAHTRTG
jgi:hypothetical protein